MKTYATAWMDMFADGCTGPTRLQVQGRSMWPTLQPGDSVVVAPVAVDELVPGDWVVVRNARGGFVHRYIGMRQEKVLTKGDAHFGCDPLWRPTALLGRVVKAAREGDCFYWRSVPQLRRERRRTVWHRAMGQLWGGLRRAKAWLLGWLGVLLCVTGVLAAVTVTDFKVEEYTQSAITLSWETASETGNMGFYMWRSTTGNDEDYAKLSEFILSQDDGMGAFYTYVDDDNALRPNTIYYYQLQDMPDNGDTGEFFGPVTATLAVSTTPEPTVEPSVTVTPTATLTPTSTPTPTSTSTLTPVPTATPHSYVRFWADAESVDAGECIVVQWLTTQVQAVYLDGQGVVGEGAQTFCPCTTQTYILNVIYNDGGGEEFSITLEVLGECESQAATATSTPLPTLLPTVPADVETATPTLLLTLTAPAPVRFPETSTPSGAASPEEIATVTRAVATATLSPTVTFPLALLPTAVEALGLGTTSDITVPGAVMATPTRVSVDGEVSAPRVTARAIYIFMLFVGIVLGLGFIGSGIWLWRRPQ